MPHPMDTLISEWTSVSKHDPRIDDNSELLSFLGTWLYSQYQPFPEKSPFWDRLFRWLDQIPNNTAPKIKKRRQLDQQVLFNFVPSLLFAAEEELLATYRAAYTGPICRWILKQSGITLDAPNLDERLQTERKATWFGSLAGMDIATFCRVNGVSGQSYRPEFRFMAELGDMKLLPAWLKEKKYRRIIIVEDIIGTGEQLRQTMGALAAFLFCLMNVWLRRHLQKKIALKFKSSVKSITDYLGTGLVIFYLGMGKRMVHLCSLMPIVLTTYH